MIALALRTLTALFALQPYTAISLFNTSSSSLQVQESTYLLFLLSGPKGCIRVQKASFGFS